MSEYLIYGADITAYGAVADGKTDCSDAFIKAIENGESLIVVPYGKYLIKKTIRLNSNTKIHLHPSALLLYAPEDSTDSPLFYAEDCNAVEICGGKINLFDNPDIQVQKLIYFNYANGIKIKNCIIDSVDADSFIFNCCENIFVSECKINSISKNAMTFTGECNYITVKKSYIAGTIVFGTQDTPCDVSGLNIRNIECKNSTGFLNFISGSAEEIRCESISGSFGSCFVNVKEEFSLEDADFESIDVHSIFALCNKNQVYFNLLGNIDGLEITNFKRKSEYEAVPFIPALILKPQEDSTAIIDGMLLDNVINARALSKTIKMTTARLTNPTGKFIYTLECGIAGGDALTIPLGDFDSLTVYTK